ncbi:MAG TPA: hypothetical protein VHD90_22865 [Phototrophicaceae bacterium]|nr:hypothetical protein [Phototrophicaceae bacterium]
MSTEDRIRDYLAQYSAGVSRDFYEVVFECLNIMRPSIDKINGLACLYIFTWFDITTEDGRAIGSGTDNIIGTIGEIAEAIAIVFYDVNSDWLWWKNEFINLNPSDTASAVIQLTTKLEASPDVKSID